MAAYAEKLISTLLDDFVDNPEVFETDARESAPPPLSENCIKVEKDTAIGNFKSRFSQVSIITIEQKLMYLLCCNTGQYHYFTVAVLDIMRLKCS